MDRVVFTTESNFDPRYTVAVREQNGRASVVITEIRDGRSARSLSLRPEDAVQIASGIDAAIACIDRMGKVRTG